MEEAAGGLVFHWSNSPSGSFFRPLGWLVTVATSVSVEAIPVAYPTRPRSFAHETGER
ncbi:MAG TPA: hypothetical protein VGM91_11215 [Conexibacter sp.]